MSHLQRREIFQHPACVGEADAPVIPIVPFSPKALVRRLMSGSALLCVLTAALATSAESMAPATPLEAQFRGCDALGWCRFSIVSLGPYAESPHRVRPDGVVQTPGNNAISIAVRDRLNFLLSNMIHQAKQILLRDLRQLPDGTFAATVLVNDVKLAADPILVELQRQGASVSAKTPPSE